MSILNEDDLTLACRHFVEIGWATKAMVNGDKFNIDLTPSGSRRIIEFAEAVRQLQRFSPKEREAITWLAICYANGGKIPPPPEMSR